VTGGEYCGHAEAAVRLSKLCDRYIGYGWDTEESARAKARTMIDDQVQLGEMSSGAAHEVWVKFLRVRETGSVEYVWRG